MTQTDATKPREMAKAYDPRATEDRVYHFWESRGYFKGKPIPGRQPFSIVMPPPNVTGELHIGHALTDTVEDILIRWHRMLGDPTLWIPGVDHAGIATQTAVERMLAKEGISRHDLGRDAFEQKLWEWVHRYRPIISNQHRRLGASADWSREVFTLDDGPQSAVRTVFKKMFDDGLIYRGERLINWCFCCLSALSDLEVEHEEQQGNLWYFRYPVVDGAEADGKPHETGEHLVVATTRPETYVGDTAVAVHPKDERFAKYIGRSVILPVIQRVVPVVGDDAVEMEFGTGAVKVTPGHDPTDFEIGRRHDLPIISVMNEDATMNEQAGPYAGMDRTEARKAIVRDLEELGYIEKIEAHTSQVGTCYRCHTVIEPLMSWQWFVNQRALAVPGIQAVKDGHVKFVPDRFERVYLNWMENIRDWCVSRQLWWGHRIPVWYSADEEGDRIMVKLPQHVAEGNVAPSASPAPAAPPTVGSPSVGAGKDSKPTPTVAATYNEFCARGVSHETIVRHGTWSAVGATPICSIDTPQLSPTGGGNLLQESDVLDTWFSSGLWPFSTLGWPRETDDLKYWYPTSVMETGYDIIFLWVARMIMLGLYCVGEIPYSVVYLHGTVRNEEGKRMSKSLGTGVDPLEIVERYGADALRYALITASGPGNDLKLSMQRVEMSRNFANKLWNATRFVLSMIGDARVDFAPLAASLRGGSVPPGLPVEDHWILSRVEGLARSVDDLMRRFEMGEATRQVYEFVWNDFCDWYIEIAKIRVRDENARGPSPLPVLAYVLDHSLRLLHPAMPFVTEELWQSLQAKIESPSVGAQPAAPSTEEALIVAAFPKGEGGFADPEAEREMESLIDVVRAIRNIRAEKKVEPAKFIEAYLVADGARALFESGRLYVETLARVRPLHVVAEADQAPRDQVATAVLEGVTAVVPLAGLFDMEAERARLKKHIAEAEAEAGRMQAKLSNEGFRAKAPENVIAQETERLATVQARLDGLRKSLIELG